MHYLCLIFQCGVCEEVFTAWADLWQGAAIQKRVRDLLGKRMGTVVSEGCRCSWCCWEHGRGSELCLNLGSHKQRLFSGQQILGVQSRQANNDLCGIILHYCVKKVSLGISINPQWRIRPPKDQHIATTYWQEKVTFCGDGFPCLGLVQISQVNVFAKTWWICTEDLVSCILFLHKS